MIKRTTTDLNIEKSRPPSPTEIKREAKSSQGGSGGEDINKSFNSQTSYLDTLCSLSVYSYIGYKIDILFSDYLFN